MYKLAGTKLNKKLILSGLVIFFCLLSPGRLEARPVPPQALLALPFYSTVSVDNPVKFVSVYSDVNGWKDIAKAQFLINTSTSGSGCFYAYYDQNTNRFYLRNDANQAWLGGFAPGSSRTIENSYAKLNCARSSISHFGSLLFVTWSVTFKPKFSGTKNLYLYVTDDRGAKDGWVKKGVCVITGAAQDTTAPVGTVSINQGAQYTTTTAVNLALSAQDEQGGSGLSQMQFSHDNTNWSNPETYAAAKSWALASTDGTKTVYVRYKDAAGNWSTPVSDSIILDTLPPEIIITSPENNALVSTPNIAVQYAVDGVSKTKPVTLVEGINTVTIQEADAAGNSGSAAITVTLDTTAPAKPQGLSVLAGDSLVNLSWTANSEPDLAGYNLYRSTDSSSYSKINTDLLTSNTYSDAGLVNGMTYYYKIAARDTLGNEGSFSDPVDATPATPVFSEHEPNNGFSSACAINLDSPVSGTINPAGDQDYFKVTAAQAGRLLVYLTNIPQNIDGYIFLFNAKQNLIASQHSGRGVSSVTLEKQISEAGDYYLRIFDILNTVSSPSPYTLKVNLADFWISNYSINPVNVSPANGDGRNDYTTVMASLSASGHWTITIKDPANNIVRTFTGTGSSISKAWDGKNASGDFVPDGVYAYTIDAVNAVTGAAALPASGTVKVDNTPGTGSITAPLANATLSGDAVIVKGLANDDNFAAHYVQYGQGASPTKWFDISYSNSPAVPDAEGNPPTIATWDTRTLANGDYILRLAIKDQALNYKYIDLLVKIENSGSDITEFEVSPNPFTPDGRDDDLTNDIANITFKLSEYGFMNVSVYDSAANLVKTIVNKVVYPDPVENKVKLQWDGSDDSYQLVRNGEYKIVASSIGGVNTAQAFVTVNDRPIFNNFKVSPNTFSPDGDGGNDTAALTFNLSEDSTTKVEVYDPQNILVRTLSAAAPAAAGQIYTYTWDGKDDNGQIAAQGRYSFKVSAVALTGCPAEPLNMNVYLLYISDLHLSQDMFNPYAGESAAIVYRLTSEAKLSIKIYDAQNNLVRNLITDQPRNAGEYSEVLDGKDNNGNILPDGHYYFTIEDSLSGAVKVVYDPAGTGGEDISHSVFLRATDFNTLKNIPSVLTYRVSKPAKVNIKVRALRFSGPAIRVIRYQEDTGSGQHEIIWDGRDELGNIVPNRSYTFAAWAYTLEDNAFVIIGGKPVISQATTTPIRCAPIPNPYSIAAKNSTTLSYNLSKDAYADICIYNENNVLVRSLSDGALKPGGANSVIWDGKNNQGEFLPNGYYRIEIQAQKDGSYSDVATAHTEVIY